MGVGIPRAVLPIRHEKSGLIRKSLGLCKVLDLKITGRSAIWRTQMFQAQLGRELGLILDCRSSCFTRC